MIKTKFTDKENLNSCIALVLLLLVIFLFGNNKVLIYVSLAVLLLVAINARLGFLISFIWYNSTFLLSKLVSTVLLSLVFILIVTPVGQLRNFIGKNSLQRMSFNKGRDSAFIVRQHQFQSSDLTNPY